ncbi:zinc finger ccch domain-containing protein [Anaeramoeba flamelloides]|uniref:Zinc finger ccch domain-containing protein n=1 Tax=Anaeramoeba flamelloides TaxID=1746091 RepID=A0ABQ8YDM9_9EUKA|nr:zinc finger ccch domain-containing protein [Anaeramoeba flamelloides]
MTQTEKSFLLKLPNSSLIIRLLPLLLQKLLLVVSFNYEKVKKQHPTIFSPFKLVESLILIWIKFFVPVKIISFFIGTSRKILKFFKGETRKKKILLFTKLEKIHNSFFKFLGIGIQSKQILANFERNVKFSQRILLKTIGLYLDQDHKKENPIILKNETGFAINKKGHFKCVKEKRISISKEIEKNLKKNSLSDYCTTALVDLLETFGNFHQNIFAPTLIKEKKEEKEKEKEKEKTNKSFKAIEKWDVSEKLIEIKKISKQINFAQELLRRNSITIIKSEQELKKRNFVRRQIDHLKNILNEFCLAGFYLKISNMIGFLIKSKHPDYWTESTWLTGFEASSTLTDKKKYFKRALFDIKEIFQDRTDLLKEEYIKIIEETMNINRKKKKEKKPFLVVNNEIFVLLKNIINLQRCVIKAQYQLFRIVIQMKLTCLPFKNDQESSKFQKWAINQIWYNYLELQTISYSEIIKIIQVINNHHQYIQEKKKSSQKSLNIKEKTLEKEVEEENDEKDQSEKNPLLSENKLLLNNDDNQKQDESLSDQEEILIEKESKVEIEREIKLEQTSKQEPESEKESDQENEQVQNSENENENENEEEEKEEKEQEKEQEQRKQNEKEKEQENESENENENEEEENEEIEQKQEEEEEEEEGDGEDEEEDEDEEDEEDGEGEEGDEEDDDSDDDENIIEDNDELVEDENNQI